MRFLILVFTGAYVMACTTERIPQGKARVLWTQKVGNVGKAVAERYQKRYYSPVWECFPDSIKKNAIVDVTGWTEYSK